MEGSLTKVLMERRDWRGRGRVAAEKTIREGLDKKKKKKNSSRKKRKGGFMVMGW